MAASASLVISGCAGTDDEWDAMVGFPAAVQSLAIAAGCEFGNLARLSETSAALVGRADPDMLELARRDAERDCHRAEARLARERPDEASLMSGPLK